MTAILVKVWTDAISIDGIEEKSIRADFNNHRHFRVVVMSPHGAKQVAYALSKLLDMIAKDSYLS